MAQPSRPETRHPNDWSPFTNGAAFELANFFFKEDQTSAAKIDHLLQIMNALLAVHGDQLPFTNHKDVYRMIDTIPIGGVPWQSYTFTYEGPKPAEDPPKWMDMEYEVWFRDPHELFLNMLKNPDFAKSFDYAPFQEFDEKGDRRYENFMSGDWAWMQAVYTLFCFSVYWYSNIVILSRIFLQVRLKIMGQCLSLSFLVVIKPPSLLPLVKMIIGHCMVRLVTSITVCEGLMVQASFLLAFLRFRKVFHSM